MSQAGEEPVRRANEPSSATRLPPRGKRPSSPQRKARIILQGPWRAAHDFNVAHNDAAAFLLAQFDDDAAIRKAIVCTAA